MRIAVLGLGLMGVPVALRLQEQGFGVTAWNRSGERREAAASAGLEVSGSVEDAVRSADCAVLTLSDAPAIGSILSGDDMEALLRGKGLIQMGTIAPGESRDLSRRVESGGAEYLEAPVLGSVPEARSGKLLVMAGGAPEVYERWLPVLRALGEQPRLIGPVGQGATLKLAMNQLIASLTAGFSASLGLIRAEGMDVELFMELLRGSALYAPTFDKKLGKMLAGDYTGPNFPLKHLIKDMGLYRQAAVDNGLDTTVADALKLLLDRAALAGHADEDYSSLYEAVDPPARRGP